MVYFKGGGSGGTIQIYAKELNATGKIWAKGGNTNSGGGGGGGRIFFRVPGPLSLQADLSVEGGILESCSHEPKPAGSPGVISYISCKPDYYRPEFGCDICKISPIYS